jgi:hypothetical protein
VPVNDDRDEQNTDAAGAPRLDNESHAGSIGPQGHRIVAGDNELRSVTLSIGSNLAGRTGEWSLTFPTGKIKVFEADGSGYRELASGEQPVAITAPFSKTLYIEGIKASVNQTDKITASFAPTTGNAVQDSVQVNVVDVDVLIGANDANDDSVHDDWVGAADPSRPAHSILNFVRVQGPVGLQVPLTVSSSSVAGGGTVQAIDPNSGVAGPVTGTLTIKANGFDNGQFFVHGGAVSAKPEDVIITAALNGQTVGSETLTVLQFGTEPETWGASPVPVNPVHVNSVAHLYGGNLFAADAGPATTATDSTARSTNLPGRFVKPSLMLNGIAQSQKIAPSEIEVVWGRHIVTSSGIRSLVTSTDFPAGLQVNPSNNGTSPDASDNLRMRDLSFPANFDNSPGTLVQYYLGHPTEGVKFDLDIEFNHAATISATPVPQKQFNIVAHIIDYVHPTTGARSATAVSDADVTTMVAQLNTIWSQVGINFAISQIITNATNNANERDVVVGYNWTRTSTNDNVAAINPSPNAIDIYFVNSIFTESNLFGGGTFDNGNTVLPSQSATPGLIIAKTNGAGAVFVRDVAGMGRTLAHEMGHYFLNNGDHDARVWNLMTGGGAGYQRDLDQSQATKLREESVVTPNNNDGQS